MASGKNEPFTKSAPRCEVQMQSALNVSGMGSTRAFQRAEELYRHWTASLQLSQPLGYIGCVADFV